MKHVLFCLLLLTVSVPAFADSLDRRGCCSHHGGVCGCKEKRAKCCDGTLSPSCGCHGGMSTAVSRSSVRRAFLKSHGLRATPVGCQVDHITPLTCGGIDQVSNLQLLCGAALHAKEQTERQCHSE